MHAAAVHADHGFRQKRGCQSHVGCNLAADQLIELNLIGSRYYFCVPVVDFKLRRRNFGMIFFILKSHGALDFRRRVDEVRNGSPGSEW